MSASLDFPRSVMAGPTGQHMVSSLEAFTEIVATNNGVHSIYHSHNSYPGHENIPIYKTERIRISQIFIDVDSSKLENALHDTRLILNWFDENNLPWTVAFSGKKGFQILLQLQPAVYSLKEKIAYTPKESYTISDFYKAFYYYLITKLELRTLDIKCAEPRRICRVWNTAHMDRKTGNFTGTFCVPLTKQQVEQWSDKTIREWATQPRPIPHTPWNEGRELIKFHELIDRFQINPKNIFIEQDKDGVMLDKYKSSASTAFQWLKRMFPHYCVHNILHNSSNPPHIIRLAMCIWLKKMELLAPVLERDDGSKYKISPTPEFVNSFYRKKQYDDYEHEDRRMYHIKHIWNQVPAYNMPSCRTLYQHGVCVGSRCPLYDRYLRKYIDDPNKGR